MVELLNTYDVCSDPVEKLADAAALEAFLQDHRIEITAPLDGHDLEAVRTLRGQLRAVVQTTDTNEAIERLNAVLADAGVVPRVVVHGDTREICFAPSGAPVVRRLACEAAIGLAMMLVEHPDRLKACAAAPCRDVFVDSSRNRSRRYCCDTCGSRSTVAAYRQRQREADPPAAAR
ncbi:MAG: CGNR zinc finger domain-containing protein [Micromonosporaceae bacterium]